MREGRRKSEEVRSALPNHWTTQRLAGVSEINPRFDKAALDDKTEVSFVPMPAVGAETGKINISETRPFKQVKKGYTGFLTGDVLFAKITPCMENGKMAVVPKLKNGAGFGSTEFHVIRGGQDLLPEYIYYFVSSKRFRVDAEHNMTGAVGQKRVPTKYLENSLIPVPPLGEQKDIVAKIETLFSELDKGIESLKTARQQLKAYRQTVLKHAFEGKLTEQWRQQNPDKLETSELLARIQQEREQRYQQQLEEWKQAVKAWEDDGKEGKKPGRPSIPTRIQEVQDSILPTLPKGWCWIEYAGICEKIRNGVSAKPSGESGEKIFRISAVRAMEFDLDDIRFLKNDGGKFNDYFLNTGDLVFTRYNGTRDYVGVCAEYKGDGTHLYPDKLIQTRLAVKSISPSYLEGAINCGGSRKFIELRIRTTAGQSGISGGDVKTMPVPICSIEEQVVIEEYLAEQLSHISAMRQEIESGIGKAEALRQSILKKAFSGKLAK